MTTQEHKQTGWKQKVLHEMKEYWLTALYMFFFFGVFSTYRRLILAHHNFSYEEYGVSVIKALVLAKVVLVAETLRLGRGFADKPLVIPTLYKSFIFTVCVAFFDVLESVIGSLFRGISPAEAVVELMNRFNYVKLAGFLVVFFTFIPFFALRELRRVLGEGTLRGLFFQRRSVINISPDAAPSPSGEK